jgi:hypothetical protein
MVKAIYFLKPAWCGNHPAGLRPEEDLQSVIVATAFQAVVCQCRLRDMHPEIAWQPDRQETGGK